MKSPSAQPSLRELQAIIPRHLRQISVYRATMAIILSLTGTGCLVAFGLVILPAPEFSRPLTILLWLPLSIAIGTAASGLWVIGHECGHGSFIRPAWLEQALGFTLHTFFLSPYVAWRRSHQMHHQRTNHVAEDIAYVPFHPASIIGRLLVAMRDLVGPTAANVLLQFQVYVIGFPIYLLFGLPGKMAWVSHFLPIKNALLPTRRLRWLVALNTVAYLIWLGAVVLMTRRHPAPMTMTYIVPLFVVNFWLLFYTLLHHTDEQVPWYDASTWTPTVGAFASIDRKYWPLINLLHHGIGRYHVYHHVSSAIPCYHGRAATEIIKDRYPHLYRYDDRNPFWCSWQIGKTGLIARATEGLYYLQAANAAKSTTTISAPQ